MLALFVDPRGQHEHVVGHILRHFEMGSQPLADHRLHEALQQLGIDNRQVFAAGDHGMASCDINEARKPLFLRRKLRANFVKAAPNSLNSPLFPRWNLARMTKSKQIVMKPRVADNTLCT